VPLGVARTPGYRSSARSTTRTNQDAGRHDAMAGTPVQDTGRREGSGRFALANAPCGYATRLARKIATRGLCACRSCYGENDNPAIFALVALIASSFRSHPRILIPPAPLPERHLRSTDVEVSSMGVRSSRKKNCATTDMSDENSRRNERNVLGSVGPRWSARSPRRRRS
jgi:hypothetical protein